MTTPDMKPGLNFGKGPRTPNPFRVTFFILGFVFIILGITSNPAFLGSGIIFVIVGFNLKDGDGTGLRGKDSKAPEEIGDDPDQTNGDGNARPNLDAKED